MMHLASDAGDPAPTPAHDLHITIACTADPASAHGKPHRLVVERDWGARALDHDLAAERVAASLGAWCSCLHAADTVVPMARAALRLASNPPAPDEALDRRRTPTPQDIGGAHLFGSTPIAPASRIESIARAERRILDELLDAIGRAWCTWADPVQVDGGRDGFADLWRDGIPPMRVDQIARMLPRESWPLPADVYRAVQFGWIDADWLSKVLPCYPERSFVNWVLARGSRAPRVPVERIWRMYDLELSADDTAAAIDAHVSPETLAELSTTSGRPARSIAGWLSMCAQLGVRPAPEHWELLAAHGLLGAPPPPWTRDTLAHRLRGFEHTAIPRTELAVMLALCPDVDAVREALRHGIRSTHDPRFVDTLTRKDHP